MQGTDLGYDDLVRMIGGAIEIINQRSEDLSLLDAAIGDGDHGVTMSRAMNKVGEIIENHPSQEIASLLVDIAWALFDIDGGAVGPLYGSIFQGMSDATTGKTSLTNQDFALMMEGGLNNIQLQTKARVGDKTMMDALIPAVQALRMNANLGMSITEMLQTAATAAMDGAEATRKIPAHYGRAKFQGDRTLGHPDPGAVSMALTFQGFLNALSK